MKSLAHGWRGAAFWTQESMARAAAGAHRPIPPLPMNREADRLSLRARPDLAGPAREG